MLPLEPQSNVEPLPLFFSSFHESVHPLSAVHLVSRFPGTAFAVLGFIHYLYISRYSLHALHGMCDGLVCFEQECDTRDQNYKSMLSARLL